MATDFELSWGESGREWLTHCRQRPWEPQKYSSKADQDANLAFLLSWVSDYYRRDGSMSLRAHREVFDEYAGRKREVTVVEPVE